MPTWLCAPSQGPALLPGLPLGGNFSPAFISTNPTPGGLAPVASESMFGARKAHPSGH